MIGNLIEMFSNDLVSNIVDANFITFIFLPNKLFITVPSPFFVCELVLALEFIYDEK